MSDLRIPQEEEQLLATVRTSLASAAQSAKQSEPPRDYSADLLQLRDDIAEARLEDVPALVAQMERLSAVASRRAEAKEAPVDQGAPYFAHLRLREDGKERDVLIGRGTHIDARNGVRIVDWRHAPVSQLYYRYPEGSSYDEVFGDREVSGDVLVRRTVTIDNGQMLRVQAPQGTFVRRDDGWRSLDARTVSLSGGQGSAARPEATRGKLGVGPEGQQRLDRHLPEIAALLDPRQFELISMPSSGVVVIQGGAGSGKTTIGLHRMAYLAFRDKHRFAPERMLVITYGIALRAYISAVLPSLGVEGVAVVTLGDWAESLRKVTIPWLSSVYDEETPSAVTKLKKHPGVLALLIARGKKAAQNPRTPKGSRGIVGVWAEVLTDLELLRETLATTEGPRLTEAELTRAHRWCSEKCVAVIESDPRDQETPDEAGEEPNEEDNQRRRGVDGHETDSSIVTIDREDDALFLRLHQIMIGPLRKGRASKNPSALYEHLFVDEAQDLAPVELAVLLECTSAARSVTLAGDTAQKLFLDNGFSDWRTVLSSLGLATTEIEPLRIAYRSTAEVLEFARDVLGPLADPEKPVASRHGAPVEAHVFPQAGAAVAFLADALRTLFAHEPRATVGVLTRFPEQADAYFEGLRRAEVPNLRRIRAQEFTFKPGVDVTEIRQVKGLEFDYVVLADVNDMVFPESDEARHLMHIGATRAAHQLWVLVTGKPSKLLSKGLLEGALARAGASRRSWAARRPVGTFCVRGSRGRRCSRESRCSRRSCRSPRSHSRSRCRDPCPAYPRSK